MTISTTTNGLQLRYFVLKPAGDSEHAIASRRALITYAASIMRDNPQLANDIHDWVNYERDQALLRVTPDPGLTFHD